MATFVVNVNESNATASGNYSRVVNNDDQNFFRLYPENTLRVAVGRLRGREPNNAWVRAPAFQAGLELYSQWGWQESRVHMNVFNTQLQQHVVTEVAKVSDRVNTTSEYRTVSIDLINNVQNVAVTNWDSSHIVSVNRPVSYDIRLVQGEPRFTFVRQWGQGGTTHEMSTISIIGGVRVRLPPGGAVRATLQMDTHYAVLEVTYRMSVSGVVAQNYNPPFAGHHFFSSPIADVMGAIDQLTVRNTTSIVYIRVSTNARIELRDLITGALLPPPAPSDIIFRSNSPQFSLEPLPFPVDVEGYGDIEETNKEAKQEGKAKLID